MFARGYQLRFLGLVIAWMLAAPQALADHFATGDMYLLTHDYPGLGAAIVRVDPLTGSKSVLYDITATALNPRVMYDPCRDRLVTRPNSGVMSFTLVDAAGQTTMLPYDWPHSDVIMWAPTGDGRIYMATNGGTAFGYVDANGNGHDLLDTDGITPFTLSFLTTSREDLIYDVGTNSLFLVHFGGAAFGNGTVVHKIPLSVDGTQLAGAVGTTSFNAFAGGADEPVGLSAGPAGTLFIKIDTNSNADGLRMFTVDPVTLVFSPFALIGHDFVAGNTTGTYNSIHGYGAALDTFNNYIRTYVDSPAVQEGAILATDISGAGGSGEAARLVTIGDTINGLTVASPCCPADLNGDFIINVGDLLALLIAWGPNPGHPADLTGDGSVDVLDLLAMLSAWGPCT